MKTKRIVQIEQYINGRDVVTIQDLVDQFHVSVNTVRRDLNLLQSEGKIKKIYGGAQRFDPAVNPAEKLMAYAERNIKNPTAKYRIAEKASSFIHEDDTIFIDTGTSTVSLLQHLRHFHHLTIITNSIYVLYSALELPQFTVICLPGIIKNKTASLVGEQCIEMINSYNINKAFMACSSISLTSGVSNSSLEEFAIKKKVLERSPEHYLLVDSTKFDKSSLLTFATLDSFNHIITDKKPSKEYLTYFSEHNVNLVLADT